MHYQKAFIDFILKKPEPRYLTFLERQISGLLFIFPFIMLPIKFNAMNNITISTLIFSILFEIVRGVFRTSYIIIFLEVLFYIVLNQQNLRIEIVFISMFISVSYGILNYSYPIIYLGCHRFITNMILSTI